MYQPSKFIDAHQHYWQPARADYGWLTPDLGLLFRDYMPDDLEPLLEKHGVVGTVAVQAADSIAETEFLIELSGGIDSLLGVVGWMDLGSDNFPEKLRQLVRHERLVGLRPKLSALANNDSSLKSKAIRHLRLLAEAGIQVDLVMQAIRLSDVEPLLREVRGLRVVVNHLGSPDLHRPETFNRWAEALSDIARHPDAMCKLSGMITLSGGYDPERWKPYVAHAIDAFGTNRLLFGSDWPVALLAGGYDEVIRLFLNSLPRGLTQEEIDRIAWRNAVEFYGIAYEDSENAQEEERRNDG